MDFDLGLGPKKKKRKDFPGSLIKIVKGYQKNRCANCNKPFTPNNPYEVDHKNGKSWDVSPKNCRLLHAGCHSKRSRKQTTERAKKTKSKKKKSSGEGFTIREIDPKKFLGG